MVSNTKQPESHPWNIDFEWENTSGPFRSLTAEQAAKFDALGYLVIDQAFRSDEIESLRRVVDQYQEESDAFLREQEDERFAIAEAGAITFTTHLVARSDEVAGFSRHRSIVDVCLDLIGPDVNLYWDQAVYKKSDKPRRFPWHQDNGYAFVEPQRYLTCWVPLTDATSENGCPQVAVGLHRTGTFRHTYVEPLGHECFRTPPSDVHVAEAPVGSLVVFSSLAPHLTGPNTSDSVRKAYILQYAPPGAVVLSGDPDRGSALARTACDDPSRQFAVARNGEPV